MSWTTAVTDLRAFLSDGAKDKRRYRKRIFGDQDGNNKVFSTFEPRRLTDFTTCSAPEGVFVDGVKAAVSKDDLTMGEFDLSYAPNPDNTVNATYYCQWFFDTELAIFLKNAVQFLGLGDDYSTLESGLQPAALRQAANEAYTKLAIRWAERASDMFLLEDSPQKEISTIIDSYRALASDMAKSAIQTRDDFYKRQGRSLSPNFSSISGSVRNLTPER
jgi:hypothetical protein